MIRSVRLIRRSAPLFLEGVTRRYGGVALLPIPRPPVFVVGDPVAASRVLVDNARNYDRRTLQYSTLSLVTGAGLLTSDGAEWREQRRRLQPAFSTRTLTAVAEQAALSAARQADEWGGLPPGTVVDVERAMLRVALDVVGTALFGADLSAAADPVVAATLAALDGVVRRARAPWALPLPVPTPGNLRLRRSVRILDEAVGGLVQDRGRQFSGGAPLPDVLDLLLAAARSGRVGDREVRDSLVTLLIAGHETVASALTWAWYLLAGSAEAGSRLREELDDCLGAGSAASSSKRLPSYDDLGRLGWTAAVVAESLRLYPPAWVLSRRALGPDVLGGYDVPAGSLVILSPWVLGRDPHAWVDPLVFRPDRFVGQGTRAHPRGSYLPFGAGPRLCIGRDFALVEAVMVLAVLASRFELRPGEQARGRPGHRGRGRPSREPRAAGQPIEIDASVTLRPRGGLPLSVWRR